jgi:protein SCO1/2
MRPKNYLIALLAGVALAAGLFVAIKSSAPVELKAALVIPAPTELPEFSLVDQSGNRVDAGTFRGQWDLVFFGFTHCPDICPATLQILTSAKRELTESGSKTIPRVVLVSVDPERDTPEVLGTYIDYFGPDNLGITGEISEIRRLTASLGIYFEKVDTNNEAYAVDHSAAVLVIDPDGKFSGLFSAPHNVQDYVHDFPLIVAGR